MMGKLQNIGYKLWCGDEIMVTDIIMDVLFEDEDNEKGTKWIVDKVLENTSRWSRAEVVMGLFQLEYEGRIYQVYPDEWLINQGWS